MMRLETPTPPLETPERALVRLPAHPQANAQPIYCEGREGRCRQKLGVLDGEYLFVRHMGRTVVTTLPAEVRCERCGHPTMLMGRAA
jgi:hypothetical protein